MAAKIRLPFSSSAVILDFLCNIFEILFYLSRMDKDYDRDSELATMLAQSQGVLYGYIYLQVGNSDIANEILQESDLYIWKNISHLDSPSNFLPWAKTMAAFQIKRFRLMAKRENAKVLFNSKVADDVAKSLAEPAQKDACTEAITFQALAHCLRSLPPPKRRLLSLRYWKHRPVAEIAATEGASPTSLAVCLLRIRRQLASCIRKLLCTVDCEVPPSPEETARAELFESAFADDPNGLHKVNDLLAADPSACSEWLEVGSIHAALMFFSDRLQLEDAAAEIPQPRGWAKKAVCIAALLAALLAVGLGFVAVTFLKERRRAVTPSSAKPAATLSSPTLSLAPSSLPAEYLRQDSGSHTRTNLKATESIRPPHPATMQKALPQPPSAALQKEKTNMNAKTKLVAATAIAAVATAVHATDGSSNSIRLYGAAEESVYWRTLMSDKAVINWEWPSRAKSAVLSITGAGTALSETFSTAVSNYVWTVPAPRTDHDENVFTLDIAFYDETDALGNCISAGAVDGIGRVRGASGATARLMGKGIDSSRWNDVYGNRAVLPIPAGTTNLTINAATEKFSSPPSWFLWSPITNNTTYEILLQTEEENSAAFIKGLALGFTVTLH